MQPSDEVKGKRGESTLYIHNLNLGNRYLQMYKEIQKAWGTTGRDNVTMEQMITATYNNLKEKL